MHCLFTVTPWTLPDTVVSLCTSVTLFREQWSGRFCMVFACLKSAVHVTLPNESACTAVSTGLTPRGITELFNILDRDSGKYTFAVSCYMLELYQDDLADLLLPASQKQQGPQKVSITAVLFMPVIHTSLAPVTC